MRKFSKKYIFNIGEIERDAIERIRLNDINVSRYLRYSLRKLDKILWERNKDKHPENCVLKFKDMNDFNYYRFLMED
jgi:hypothetical protein